MNQSLSNYLAYVTEKCTIFCLSTIDACLLCQNKVPQKSLHAKFGFLQKTLVNNVRFSFVSHGSSPRPLLETSVSFAKVPDFLSELPPTGAFHPEAVLLLPGVLPRPFHLHLHLNVSLLHICSL